MCYMITKRVLIYQNNAATNNKTLHPLKSISDIPKAEKVEDGPMDYRISGER